MKFNSLSLLFLVIVTIIIPPLILLDINAYFEFLILSILSRLILGYLSPKNHSVVIFNFLNLAQGIYLILILIMWSFAHDDLGNLDTSKLIGDSQTYFIESLTMSNFEGKSFSELGETSNINYFFFPYMISKVIFLFKSKYLVSLMFVTFIGLLNLLLLFKIGILLNLKTQIIKTVGVFYILFPHILSSNIILLKDSTITFSLLLLVYAAISVRKKQNNLFKLAIYILISLFLCTFLRLPFLIIYFLIFSFLAFKKINKLIYLIPFIFISSIIAFNLFSSQLFEFYLINENMQENLKDSGVTGSGFTNALIGGYSENPLHLKIIKLPLAVIVQYLTPINVYNFSHINPWSYIDINMKIVWLMFFGPLFIFCSTQLRYLTHLVKRILIISVLGYASVAFLQSGIVPRYALSFMCLSVIPLAYVFQEIKYNVILRKKYLFFNRVYFSLAFFLAFFYIIIKL